MAIDSLGVGPECKRVACLWLMIFKAESGLGDLYRVPSPASAVEGTLSGWFKLKPRGLGKGVQYR